MDTPLAIYTRPRTSFVARFVGQGTLVPGEAKGGFFHRDRPWPVRVEGEGRGYLLLRPEALRLAPGGFLRGRVVLATYLGNLARLEVEVEGEGLLLKVDTSPEGAPEMGAQVGLALPEAAPFVKEEA